MAQDDKRLQELKQKYASVLRTIEQEGVQLANLHVQDNKLFLKGQAPSAAVKNKVWDQIKLVNPAADDITADLTAPAGEAAEPKVQAAAAGGGGGQSYTVQPGDTLSKISKQFYGNANDYMQIFNANKDQLTDPDKIKPGQVLTIPPH